MKESALHIGEWDGAFQFCLFFYCCVCGGAFLCEFRVCVFHGVAGLCVSLLPFLQNLFEDHPILPEIWRSFGVIKNPSKLH